MASTWSLATGSSSAGLLVPALFFGQTAPTTIAFPAISTGAYRFPIDQAAHIAVTELLNALATRPHLLKVRLVCFSDRDARAYRRALERQLGNTASE